MTPGQRMVCCQDHMERIATQILPLDTFRSGMRLLLPFVGQDEIDVPECQRRQGLLRLRLDELAAQVGRLPRERPHRRDRKAERHRLEGGDAPPARDRAGRGGEVGFRTRNASA